MFCQKANSTATKNNLGEKRALGFYLDLTGVLTNDHKFKVWSQDLLDKRVQKEEIEDFLLAIDKNLNNPFTKLLCIN